jgi:hypothetical protein
MLLLSAQLSIMPRNTRSKPSNVVKSRSAPSLLGGFSSPRQPQDHLPSNRFIELGDIALGNSRRHGPYGEIDVPTVAVPEPISVPEVKSRTQVQRRPKPSKTTQPNRSSKPQSPVVTSRPKVLPPPLTRPKPPRPPAARPNLALPPKFALPKPPKIYRPKPQTGRPQSSTRRSRPQ